MRLDSTSLNLMLSLNLRKYDSLMTELEPNWRCRLRHRWTPWRESMFFAYRKCRRCGIEEETILEGRD